MKVAYRGPALGYASDEKQKYRQEVWGAIANKIMDVLDRDERAHVLMLPSKGGEEIEVAISHGIPEDRIIAVDENPALLASAKWRKSRPLVKCYGSSLSRAAERIKNDGIVLAAANLDLCNNFSEDLVSEISGFFDNCYRFYQFCFSVTVMKGRENKATSLMLNHIFKNSPRGFKKIEDKRIRALCAVMDSSESFPLSQLSCIEAQGNYIHSKTPMAWCVFSCGFNDKLKSIRNEAYLLCKDFSKYYSTFVSLKNINIHELAQSWPEEAEKNCIRISAKIKTKADEYFDCLKEMCVIDDAAEAASRFFLYESTEANDILFTMHKKEFKTWMYCGSYCPCYSKAEKIKEDMKKEIEK